MPKNYGNIKDDRKGIDSDAKKETEKFSNIYNEIINSLQNNKIALGFDDVVFKYDLKNKSLNVFIKNFGEGIENIDFKEALKNLLFNRDKFKNLREHFNEPFKKLLYFYIMEKLGGKQSNESQKIYYNIVKSIPNNDDSVKGINKKIETFFKQIYVLKNIKKAIPLVIKKETFEKRKYGYDIISLLSSKGIYISYENFDFDYDKDEEVFTLTLNKIPTN